MKILIFALLFSLSVHAQQESVEEVHGSDACRMTRSGEQSKMSSFKSAAASRGESYACLDELGEMFAECMNDGADDINCKNAKIDQSEEDISKEIAASYNKTGIVKYSEEYGIVGGVRVLVNRELNEANCIRLRAHCAKRAQTIDKGDSCYRGAAPEYYDDVFGYITQYRQCMENTAKSIETAAVKIVYPDATKSEIVSITEKARAIGVSDTITCENTTHPYRFCSFHKGTTNSNVAIAEPKIPTPADPMPDLPTPKTLHGEPYLATLQPVVPNTCPGTILGDGVTVITSPTCQVMQNNPQMIIQSVNASGQKVSLPATCEASATSNKGDSVECKLQSAQNAKPLYQLQSNNELKTCRTDGWVVSCPESFIEQSLQKRVKVLGVAGSPPAKPVEGYVHYNKRTGQLSTASVGQGVNSNGVMLEFQGRPVIVHTRAPASALAPTGDAYAVDKFVVQTSKTGLSPELMKQGLPLMREIALGDK